MLGRALCFAGIPLAKLTTPIQATQLLYMSGFYFVFSSSYLYFGHLYSLCLHDSYMLFWHILFQSPFQSFLSSNLLLGPLNCLSQESCICVMKICDISSILLCQYVCCDGRSMHMGPVRFTKSKLTYDKKEINKYIY